MLSVRSLLKIAIFLPPGLAKRHRYLFAIACIRKALQESLEIASTRRQRLLHFQYGSPRLCQTKCSRRLWPW